MYINRRRITHLHITHLRNMRDVRKKDLISTNIKYFAFFTIEAALKEKNLSLPKRGYSLRVAPILEAILHITKTRLFKYIENFTSKNWKFQKKKQTFSYLCSKH